MITTLIRNKYKYAIHNPSMSAPPVDLNDLFNGAAGAIARIVADVQVRRAVGDECKSEVLSDDCVRPRLSRFLQNAQGYDSSTLDNLANELRNCIEVVYPLGCCVHDCDLRPRATILINTDKVWEQANKIYDSYDGPDKDRVSVQGLYVELLKLVMAHEYAHCLMAVHRCVLGSEHSVYNNLPWVFSHVIEESLATAFEYSFFQNNVEYPFRDIIEKGFFNNLPPGYSGFKEWFAYGIPVISALSIGPSFVSASMRPIIDPLGINESCFVWGTARVLTMMPNKVLIFEKPPLKLPPLLKELIDMSNNMPKPSKPNPPVRSQANGFITTIEELYDKYGGDLLWRLVAIRILKSPLRPGGSVGIKDLSR